MSAFSVIAIIAGEILIIWSEVMAAKLYAENLNMASMLMQTVPLGIAGAVLLIVGYALGLKYFHNIWIVTAVSVGSLLMVEPLFNYFYMGQTPTMGSGIGFVLGALGMVASLVF